MTQEQKDLLLKDLCGRLPYEVKAAFFDAEDECENFAIVEYIDVSNKEHEIGIGQYSLSIDKIKPYLFPLSSMTEEQEEELKKLLGDSVIFSKYNEWFYDMDGYSRIYLSNIQTAIDWFNKNHFDYRGLIEENLAIDATGLNIY